jgi:hypothetical protein
MQAKSYSPWEKMIGEIGQFAKNSLDFMELQDTF